jgi:Thiamine pyrophosphate enzyme, N-terminal TPP binding domain
LGRRGLRDEDSDRLPTSRRGWDSVEAPSSRSSVPLALQLVDELRAHDVDTVFGTPGGAVSSVYAALRERPDVCVINAKHETGAVFMAMGYTIATGKPGVVLTSAGPGITNAITGMASAFHDGIPILLLCELGIRGRCSGTTDMLTPVIDFAVSRRAPGAAGYIVRTRAALGAALALSLTGLLVLDVRIDSEIRLQGGLRNAALPQLDASSPPASARSSRGSTRRRRSARSSPHAPAKPSTPCSAARPRRRSPTTSS